MWWQNDWLYAIVVGGIIGFLADSVVPGYKMGFFGAIIAGILGGYVGTWLFCRLGWSFPNVPSPWNQLIVGFIGAIIVVLIIRMIRRQQ